MISINYHNISNEALKLLIHIHDNGYAEYWDREFLTTYDFLKSSSSIFMTIEKFKIRNCGGTYYLACELLHYKLIELNCDDNYILSDIGGKTLINVIRKNKLEKLEKL